MKKFTTSLLLVLLLFALSGCAGKTTGTSDNASGSGTSDTGTSSDATPGTNSGAANNQTSGKPLPTPTETITPTPTPEGDYVGFSLESGFYDKNQELTLYCNVPGAKIYYTLDGSIPTESST